MSGMCLTISERSNSIVIICFAHDKKLLVLCEGGVLDFTGELNRFAVARATVRDKAAVQRCRDLVEEIMVRF